MMDFSHPDHVFIEEVLIARLAGLNPSAMVLARAQNILIEEQQKQIRLSQSDKSHQATTLKRQKDEEANILLHFKTGMNLYFNESTYRMMCLKSPMESNDWIY